MRHKEYCIAENAVLGISEKVLITSQPVQELLKVFKGPVRRFIPTPFII